MDYYSFIGYLVVGLGVIVSLFLAVFMPLMKIVARLTTIENKLDTMNGTLGSHSSKIDEHEQRLNDHDKEFIKLNSNRGRHK